jgi:hypothetical protein
MTNNELELYPQDDLSGTLSVPAGAEHIPPMRPAAVEAATVSETLATPVESPRPPERASLTIKIVVGAALAVCATLGAVLLMRGA